MSICSETWTQHVSHLRRFISDNRKSGLTLSLKKCSLAQNEARFVGHIIGSERHRPDEKLATISDLAKPKTKRTFVRRLDSSITFILMYHI
jgi:hypothetical protein